MWLDLQKLSLSAQERNSNLLLIIKPLLLHYLRKNTKHIAIDDQLCFHWKLIANPVKPPWYNTEYVGPVSGTNKDVTDARLLPMIVLTCPVDWVSFCHLLKTHTAVCVLMEGTYNPPPATHPPSSPTPPPTAHPPPITCHAWYYSRCEKSCSKPSSVSWLAVIVTRH